MTALKRSSLSAKNSGRKVPARAAIGQDCADSAFGRRLVAEEIIGDQFESKVLDDTAHGSLVFFYMPGCGTVRRCSPSSKRSPRTCRSTIRASIFLPSTGLATRSRALGVRVSHAVLVPTGEQRRWPGLAQRSFRIGTSAGCVSSSRAGWRWRRMRNRSRGRRSCEYELQVFSFVLPGKTPSIETQCFASFVK